MKPTLLILAAGMGSRYGGLKQLDGLGPNEEVIIEYSIFDAIRAGFGKIVFVIREDIETAFREKFGGKFDDQIEIEYAFQAMDTPIEGIDAFPEREKPWGTAHAVLVAHDKINEPFAVINADDYYGISSFEAMAAFLTSDVATDHYSMIGYQLDKTLSDAGHVNRGVCDVDEAGHLTDVVERHKIQRTPDGIIFEEDGAQHPLSADALVSMNFWGFHPNIFDITRQHFIQFVKDNQDKPRAEFYIPLVVNSLINDGKINLAVIPNAERWYGVTYQEDKPMVQNAFAQLVAEGKYPEKLWS
ncbi:MAG: hypothetical protein KI786_01620 [Mameliella sp.]|nr:hypothetical protein [Phaeodactylibacter sp.]NRA48898.1 nucleotidyltransferase [Phaeodactylibacter sp.]